MAFDFNINATNGVSRCIQFATNSTEVTRVVEGDRWIVLGVGQFAFLLEVVDEL